MSALSRWRTRQILAFRDAAADRHGLTGAYRNQVLGHSPRAADRDARRLRQIADRQAARRRR